MVEATCRVGGEPVPGLAASFVHGGDRGLSGRALRAVAVERDAKTAAAVLRGIANRDVAALWPWRHAPVGQGASPWGDAPVRLFRTGGGQSYAFQLRVSAKPQSNGRYLVFAPTGAGKTTSMLRLLGGLAKFFWVRAFVFDLREGARFGIEALGRGVPVV